MKLYEPISEQLAIIVFYSISRGIQSALAFSKEFRHCNTITFDGASWIMLDFDSKGFLTREIKCSSGERLMSALRLNPDISAVIGISVKEKARHRWMLYLVRSCNEICRYSSGVDIGLTFNPVHLYRKLLKYGDTRNYQILHAWRRQDGTVRRR